ncbi:small integral membrane protein-protein [Staphylococcus agnetis]|uniref:DUF2273 domain-containing protein n=1 Tax=Staphylococcus agnetis TaxID=985762 RepID=UPI000E08CBA5|nr:DUF2273 domain-containing protein [Staphylococcus agnetis]SUK12792.1 small integral membrane protein-protein [Staphylococcus agnetis]
MKHYEPRHANNDNNEKLIQFIKVYKWRLIGFFTFLILAILFITLGFWKTLLIVFLCLIGLGIGYIKDCTQEFINFINRIS